MPSVILDTVSNIELDLNDPPLKNFHALHYLRFGLFILAKTVRTEETKINKEDPYMTFEFNLVSAQSPIIMCMFHWFSISVVNYLRLVGLVDLMNTKNWKAQDIIEKKNRYTVKKHCDKYVEEVIPTIWKWRHKVSAHFAITYPYDQDNLGTLEHSIMQQLDYIKPYYKVAAGRWSKGENQESALESWSLTEIYERLTPRFWSDLPIGKIPTMTQP